METDLEQAPEAASVPWADYSHARVVSVSPPPLAVAGVLMLAALGAITVLGFRVTGLSVAWPTAIPYLAIHVVLGGLWLYHYRVPDKDLVADLLLVLLLTTLATNIGSPAQYAAVALKRPVIDSALAAADAALGIRVPSLAAWTWRHPWVASFFYYSYFSLLPQLILAPILLALVRRRRDDLWEYYFHFNFCLVVTLATLALFPAECVFTHYGFEAIINEARFIEHFQGLRDGTFSVVQFNNLEGLISMPSFHVAGALMVTWAFRHSRVLLAPFLALNLALIASTVMTGSHYFIDLVATLLLFALSVAVFRRCAPKLLKL